jgi:hypothetical protein
MLYHQLLGKQQNSFLSFHIEPPVQYIKAKKYEIKKTMPGTFEMVCVPLRKEFVPSLGL